MMVTHFLAWEQVPPLKNWWDEDFYIVVVHLLLTVDLLTTGSLLKLLCHHFLGFITKQLMKIHCQIFGSILYLFLYVSPSKSLHPFPFAPSFARDGFPTLVWQVLYKAACDLVIEIFGSLKFSTEAKSIWAAKWIFISHPVRSQVVINSFSSGDRMVLTW